jgi:hypothetical protein
LNVPHDEWKITVERIIKKWTSYTDTEGKPLAIRTHWAKEWDSLSFNGLTGRDFVKKTYENVVGIFKQDLNEIAKTGGYGIDDMKARFSNQLWDDVIFGQPETAVIKRL